MTPTPSARAIAEAARFLAEQGIDQGRREAELILAHVTAASRLSFYAHPEQALTPQQESNYWGLVKRRGRGEPVAYLFGEKEFFSLPFWVDRSVLIPRPETEHVVEATIADLRGRIAAGHRPVFIDVGTGSGAIAVAVLFNVPESRALATEISPAAIAVARRNAERHGVADRLELIEGDLFAGLADPVDVIVSNPPYVGDADRDQLARDVRAFEPSEALYAGPDALSVIRRLIAEAPDRLLDGGRLIFEFGCGQDGPVRGLFAADGRWLDPEIREDLAGIPRVAVAQIR